MPKALTEEEVREKIESIGYDRDRLEYVGYIANHKDENGKTIWAKILWKIRPTGEIAEQLYSSFVCGHKPNKTNTEHEIELTSSKHFDHKRFKSAKYIPEYKDKDGKRFKPKILWEVKATGEMIEQHYVSFMNRFPPQQPSKTKGEYKKEIFLLLKEKGVENQYAFEIKMQRYVWIHLTRIFDSQKGIINLSDLRSGHFPKQFVCICWDLESAIKAFKEQQPGLAKQIEILEYFDGQTKKLMSRK